MRLLEGAPSIVEIGRSGDGIELVTPGAATGFLEFEGELERDVVVLIDVADEDFVHGLRLASPDVVRRERSVALGPQRLAGVLADELADAVGRGEGGECLARVDLAGRGDRLDPGPPAHVR